MILDSIFIQNYKNTKEILWYSEIQFSSSSFRCTKLTKPIKVSLQVDEYTDGSFRVKVINDRSGVLYYSYISSKNSTTLNYEINIPRLFSTEEECKEDFNRSVLDQIDRLQYFYEKNLKNLKSKLQ